MVGVGGSGPDNPLFCPSTCHQPSIHPWCGRSREASRGRALHINVNASSARDPRGGLRACRVDLGALGRGAGRETSPQVPWIPPAPRPRERAGQAPSELSQRRSSSEALSTLPAGHAASASDGVEPSAVAGPGEGGVGGTWGEGGASAAAADANALGGEKIASFEP